MRAAHFGAPWDLSQNRYGDPQSGPELQEGLGANEYKLSVYILLSPSAFRIGVNGRMNAALKWCSLLHCLLSAGYAVSRVALVWVHGFLKNFSWVWYLFRLSVKFPEMVDKRVMHPEDRIICSSRSLKHVTSHVDMRVSMGVFGNIEVRLVWTALNWENSIPFQRETYSLWCRERQNLCDVGLPQHRVYLILRVSFSLRANCSGDSCFVLEVTYPCLLNSQLPPQWSSSSWMVRYWLLHWRLPWIHSSTLWNPSSPADSVRELSPSTEDEETDRPGV